MKTHRNPISVLLCTIIAGAIPASAVILQPGTDIVQDGVIFQAASSAGSAGTGHFGTFLRLQNDGSEVGYNTGLTPMPDVKAGTKEVLLSELTTITLASGEYVQLALDINESEEADHPELTITAFKVYVTDTAVTSGTNPSLLGTPIFDLGSTLIDLDASIISSGSGKSDMFVYIPISYFSGKQADDHFYLYSQFGGTGTGIFPSDDGFEEWGNSRVARRSYLSRRRPSSVWLW